MTLEILIQNNEPSEATTGTFLSNLIILDIDFEFNDVKKTYKTLSGAPRTVHVSNNPAKISFNGVVYEYDESSEDSSLGLIDLDLLRQATQSTKVWLRDTQGEYFLNHWKGGFITKLKVKPYSGHDNVVGNVLYSVSFDFYEDYASNTYHRLTRYS